MDTPRSILLFKPLIFASPIPSTNKLQDSYYSPGAARQVPTRSWWAVGCDGQVRGAGELWEPPCRCFLCAGIQHWSACVEITLKGTFPFTFIMPPLGWLSLNSFGLQLLEECDKICGSSLLRRTHICLHILKKTAHNLKTFHGALSGWFIELLWELKLAMRNPSSPPFEKVPLGLSQTS